eukprot:GHRR01016433.1.p1 GENE.GHRR01016433.1~~GHRR01016433.1.p1  ORF type:complete len:207 (-),score=101.66 GHRR01016433.1:294-914(-)
MDPVLLATAPSVKPPVLLLGAMGVLPFSWVLLVLLTANVKGLMLEAIAELEAPGGAICCVDAPAGPLAAAPAGAGVTSKAKLVLAGVMLPLAAAEVSGVAVAPNFGGVDAGASLPEMIVVPPGVPNLKLSPLAGAGVWPALAAFAVFVPGVAATPAVLVFGANVTDLRPAAGPPADRAPGASEAAAALAAVFPAAAAGVPKRLLAT